MSYIDIVENQVIAHNTYMTIKTTLYLKVLICSLFEKHTVTFMWILFKILENFLLKYLLKHVDLDDCVFAPSGRRIGGNSDAVVYLLCSAVDNKDVLIYIYHFIMMVKQLLPFYNVD